MVLRRVNTALSLMVLGLGLYLVGMPIYPAAKLWVLQLLDQGPRYASHLSGTSDQAEPLPDGNRLVIPDILVEGEVYEGSDPSALNNGIWRRPNTSTPAEGGNTVLVAHRYLYKSGPNTFYNLNRVEIGDEFFLTWEGREYDYRVREIKEVGPNETGVEDQTSTPVVTLYTCTPLWTASRRLVVVADLIGDYELK